MMRRALVAAMLLAARAVDPDGAEQTGALVSSGLPWEHSCRADDSSCALLEDSDDRFYADRLVRGALRIIKDPECQQGFSLDAKMKGFVNEAARVFRKCRVLVVRNAMEREVVEDFKVKLAEHVEALRVGKLSMRGETTHGEDYFVFPLGNANSDGEGGTGHKRWLMLLPAEYAAPEIVAPPFLTKLLSHPRILDADFVLNDAGVAISEPGGGPQVWHKDDDYLFGEESLAVNGMAGHDFGSFSVTVMHPLLDVTPSHGPTEFCMGTSMMSGYDYEANADDPDMIKALKDPALMDELWAYLPDPPESEDDSGGQAPACFSTQPDGSPGARRVEPLNVTDVVLFDYQMRHRGGPNDSEDLRSLLYLTYARKWYKDHNFQARSKVGATEDLEFKVGGGFDALSVKRRKSFAKIIASARFAKTQPGPRANATVDGPAPRLVDIRRPFAYDPSSTRADEYHETWRESLFADAATGPPKPLAASEL